MDAHIFEPENADVDGLSQRFDEYRAFYGRTPDPDGARAFVAARIADRATRFFIAARAGEVTAFAHLVPVFDTLAMTRAWILEDLFVAPAARRSGTGGALLRHAERFARASGATRIALTTAHTNATAQRLYHAHGYVLDEVFRAYAKAL